MSTLPHAPSMAILSTSLYDETRHAVSSYPYGISKLQGEQAVLSLSDEHFSVISLRKGTLSGYSPRMRLDLIINSMFKCAQRDRVIRVDNPSIWRPILSVDDAATAYIRAIEAHESISGVFNVASGNYTVGEVADSVKSAIEADTGTHVQLNICHVADYRNYKVSTAKASDVLSFHAQDDVYAIVRNLLKMQSRFEDWDNPRYYNIATLKKIELESSEHLAWAAAAASGTVSELGRGI